MLSKPRDQALGQGVAEDELRSDNEDLYRPISVNQVNAKQRPQVKTGLTLGVNPWGEDDQSQQSQKGSGYG